MATLNAKIESMLADLSNIQSPDLHFREYINIQKLAAVTSQLAVEYSAHRIAGVSLASTDVSDDTLSMNEFRGGSIEDIDGAGGFIVSDNKEGSGEGINVGLGGGGAVAYAENDGSNGRPIVSDNGEGMNVGLGGTNESDSIVQPIEMMRTCKVNLRRCDAAIRMEMMRQCQVRLRRVDVAAFSRPPQGQRPRQAQRPPQDSVAMLLAGRAPLVAPSSPQIFAGIEIVNRIDCDGYHLHFIGKNGYCGYITLDALSSKPLARMLFLMRGDNVSLIVNGDEQLLQLQAGGSVNIPFGLCYEIRNDGEEPAVLYFEKPEEAAALQATN